MKLLGKIRRLCYREGLTYSEMARRTGCARNTVKRWLKTPEGTEPEYRRRESDTKIAPYAAQLVKALEVDAHRPKRDRRTVLKLYGEIQAAGFTGDYSRVTEFVRRWREQGGQALVKAFVSGVLSRNRRNFRHPSSSSATSTSRSMILPLL